LTPEENQLTEILYFYRKIEHKMEIFYSKKPLIDYIQRNKEMGKKIGFAPTMGALHKGHLSLYETARKDNDIVIASVFVNPTQFNNAEDFKKYPRDVETDIILLESSQLVDIVYVPKVEDIYPDGMKSKHYDFDGIENLMEGKFRPGHFDGVGTVVEELLRQVQPDQAYFGEKDFQQLLIIKKLVEKLKLPIHIIGVPIYRENSGLAFSSRNARLNLAEKEDAKLLYETLHEVKEWIKVIDIPEINRRVHDLFENQNGMKLEYFEIADESNLEEATAYDESKKYRAFIVVYVGEVRLIDNLRLN